MYSDDIKPAVQIQCPVFWLVSGLEKGVEISFVLDLTHYFVSFIVNALQMFVTTY